LNLEMVYAIGELGMREIERSRFFEIEIHPMTISILREFTTNRLDLMCKCASVKYSAVEMSTI